MDNVSCGVQSITISPGESRMLRATALEVLERTLDEIARNNRFMSRGEKMMREALHQNNCMLCVRTRSRVGAGGSHHDVDVGTIVKSLAVHAHLPRLLSCLYYLESEDAGGVHEICGNPVSILSSFMLMTRPDLLGRSC